MQYVAQNRTKSCSYIGSRRRLVTEMSGSSEVDIAAVCIGCRAMSSRTNRTLTLFRLERNAQAISPINLVKLSGYSLPLEWIIPVFGRADEAVPDVPVRDRRLEATPNIDHSLHSKWDNISCGGPSAAEPDEAQREYSRDGIVSGDWRGD